MKYSLNKFIINIAWSILGTLVSYSFCRWDRNPGNTKFKNFNWYGSYCQWNWSCNTTRNDSLSFKTRCDLRKPNNLQVNWPDGNKFHMLELIYTICTNDPKINHKPPAATFDTRTGEGTGRFNGAEGATINFILVDQGEPGKSDTGWIQIFDKHEQEVLNVEGSMKYGNLQAHN